MTEEELKLKYLKEGWYEAISWEEFKFIYLKPQKEKEGDLDEVKRKG